MATYVYYDTEGVIKEVISDYPYRKGSEEVAIYFYFEGSSTSEKAFITGKKPDKTTGAFANYEWVDDVIKFDADKKPSLFVYHQTYHFLKLTLTFDLAGIWEITPTTENQACEIFNIYVQDNTNEVPETFTFSDYKSLLQKIKDLGEGSGSSNFSVEEDTETGIITLEIE